MNKYFIHNRIITTLCCALFFTASSSTIAQDLELPTSVQPKLIGGHPDFQGVWVNNWMSFINLKIGEDGSVICIVGCPPSEKEKAAASTPRAPRRKPQRPSYKDEYLAKVKDLDERQVKLDPGLPRIGPPSAIVQNATHIAFLYEDLGGSFFL